MSRHCKAHTEFVSLCAHCQEEPKEFKHTITDPLECPGCQKEFNLSDNLKEDRPTSENPLIDNILQKRFNLSEKMMNGMKGKPEWNNWYKEKDVKEFIRLLKQNKHCPFELLEEIDKLAGKQLT